MQLFRYKVPHISSIIIEVSSFGHSKLQHFEFHGLGHTYVQNTDNWNSFGLKIPIVQTQWQNIILLNS